LTREPQLLGKARHRGHTHVEPALGIELLTEFSQGGIGTVLDHTAHEAYRRPITAGASAARVGLGRDCPGGAATPPQLLDKGLADTKHRGNGSLGVEPLVTGTENLLSQVKGISFHASQHSVSIPYIQFQTAVGHYPVAAFLDDASDICYVTSIVV
jgi:hypothetical protein